MKFTFPVLSVLSLLLLGAVPLRAETVTPSIRGSLEAFVEKGSLSGAVAVFSHNGKVVSEGALGFRDLATRPPCRSTTFSGSPQ